MLDRIEIKKDQIPYMFDIVLGDQAFRLRVDYNPCADLFTLSIYLGGALICAGEPLVYGQPLFFDVYTARQFPALTITPLDESGQEDQLTWSNFGETVFLCVEDEKERGEV